MRQEMVVIGNEWNFGCRAERREFTIVRISKCDETSAQRLVQIHNQVVGILNPDRNANSVGVIPSRNRSSSGMSE
jgi:hypothetical protein